MTPSDLDPIALGKARQAVRDEAGSRLCAWVDMDGREEVERGHGVRTKCYRELGHRFCLCESVAGAVIDSLTADDVQAGIKEAKSGPVGER